jgi:hypothetical protein
MIFDLASCISIIDAERHASCRVKDQAACRPDPRARPLRRKSLDNLPDPGLKNPGQ